MLHRVLAAALLALTLNSCAAGTGVFGKASGRVSGHVTVRACGGAVRADQNGCRTTPVSGAQLSFQLGGLAKPSTATTNAGGAYTVDLTPGTYAVRVTLQKSTSPLPAAFSDALASRSLAGPKTVTVVAGTTTTADFTYTVELL